MKDIDMLRNQFLDILMCLVDPLELTKEDLLGVTLLCNTEKKMHKMVDWLKREYLATPSPK